MLPVVLAALATLTFTPGMTFTSDSVYTKDNILSVEIVEHEIQVEESEETIITKELVFHENHLLGYTIYDNKDTDYVDGLKFDDKFVYGWRVENFDDTVEHKLVVKTVYTDDAAGMLVAAKDGDYSKLLSNPLIIVQLGYYLLAAISIIVGGFGIFKSKKKKIKDHNQIAHEVTKQAELAKNALIETSIEIITPLFKQLGNQNASIIKALIMNKSKDDNDTLLMLDMLKDAQSDEEMSALVERIKINAAEAFNRKLTEQKEAKATIKAIAEGTFKPDEDKGSSNGEGGIAI